MTSHHESNNALAFRILRDSKLKHPDRPLFQTFITEAVNTEEASTYLARRCPSGPDDSELTQFLVDWKALVKIFAVGDATTIRLDSGTTKRIAERDGHKCCLSGRPSRFWNSSSVVPILPLASLHIEEDRLNDMLDAFISPARRNYLRSLSQPLPVNLYRNHWALCKVAAEAFSRGEVMLDEEDGKDMYAAFYTAIGGNRLLSTHARFAKAIKWSWIALEMSKRGSPTHHSPKLTFYFDLTAVWLGLWLKMPARIRVQFYKALRAVGYYIYGPTTIGVQKLPFWMYLKHGPASHSQGHAGEFGALKLVRTHTAIPVPRPIDHISTSEHSYLVTSQLGGEPAGINLALCTDDEAATMAKDLKQYIMELRAIPAAAKRDHTITNAIGHACLDFRISGRAVGPFANEQEFNDILHLGVEPELVHGDNHKIVLTHGDLNMRNILVKDGKISGIVDWENAGWYPEYWEYIKCH